MDLGLKDKVAMVLAASKGLGRASAAALAAEGAAVAIGARNTQVVAFLASQQAAYITGTTIQVDGGLTRSLL